MKILILGGTGYVGSNLIPRLISEGRQVRCLVRDPAKLAAGNIEIHQGDASDPKAVESAIKGCDGLVYLIHSMNSRSTRFEDLDRRIAENVATAVQSSGIRQVIYLGGLGKKNIAQTPHLRSRHEVAAILRSSGAPVTELRAAAIIGSGSASFEMIRSLVTRLPIMICPKWVNVKTQPIAIRDVLEYITRSLNNPDVLGRTFDIGGPDIVSYRYMMLAVGRHLGLRRLIFPVPVLTPWLSSHWVNLVTSVSAPLARALIESVRSETICENDLALRTYDFKPIGFEEAALRAIKG